MTGQQKSSAGATYRVVGTRLDGSREVRASNLVKSTAEALRDLMETWPEYKRVVVEPQAKMGRS